MQLNSQYIGNLIKSMRKQAGLTQYELAERIGVGNKTVSKWEQGRGIPDISLLYRLSLALDMDIESILAGDLDDLGKEWMGIIYTGGIEDGLISGRRDLEYFISMFLLVGIRNIVVISSDIRKQEDEKLLKEYQKKGFLKEAWCDNLSGELVRNAGIEGKRICFLYQPAFLYGMHLTKYMRRAMQREKIAVLALRQGENSFMPKICYNDKFLCVRFQEEELIESEWYMFPMIFGYGEHMKEYFELIKGSNDNRTDINRLLSYFKEVCVEPMERGMLAFSMVTESERRLATQVISGIEESQHIQIGNPEEIMMVRGWK